MRYSCYSTASMDCFGFCGEKCSKKKKKSKEKYKEERNGGVPIPLQEETQFPESTGNRQEMGTRPESPLQASPETRNLSRQPADVMQDGMPNRSRGGLNYVKQTGQVKQKAKKKTPHKPKNHEHQETSDSDSDSSSDSITDESPSSEDSYDSPEERTKSIKTKKKSKSIVINASRGIVDFGKHNTNKIVHIQYERQKKKGKTKDRSSKNHTRGSRPKDAPLYKCSTKSNVTNELTNPFQKWPSKVFTQPSQGNFKAQFDRTDNVYNNRLLVNLAISIGIIRSPQTCGTGFRVGRNFVMTAKHVIDGILNGGPFPFGQQEQSKHNLLRCPNVYIDFSYELPNCPADKNSIFLFEEIVFENQELDVAILRLMSSESSYPPPIINFHELVQEDGDLYFIGHSRADIKKMDKVSCVPLPSNLQVPAGYEGVNNPRCQLLHCTFEQGASGAPGIWICPFDHMPYVVLMLLRGYPGWYYDEKTPIATKLAVTPHVDCVEQGVRMDAIYYEMRKINPSLHSEIFHYKSAELPTPSYDDVEMKSQENC